MLRKEKIMRKLLFALLITLTGSAQAQWHHHHHHRHGYNWVAPIIIGGAVGYAIANSSRPQPAPPVVYMEQPQATYTCPYGYQPIFNRVWVTDQWGRSMLQNQFIGCQ